MENNIFKLKKETDFDKLFIDTSYVFDVMFWVETEWIKNTKGDEFYLKDIVATRTREDSGITMLLNVSKTEDDCESHQESIEQFENGLEIKQQILELLEENMSEIKYTIKDRILNIKEIQNGIISLLDRCVEGVNSYKVYEKIKQMNKNAFSLKVKGNINLESNIYYAEDKDCYLLECRLFDDSENGSMLDAYLMVVDPNMKIVEEYIDDVWAYAKFEKMNGGFVL